MSVYATLTQEPWCFHPDQIARLTDWQIEYLYFAPARARAAEFRRASGQAGAPREPPPQSGPPTRAQYIAGARMLFGDSRDWGAEYDRLTGKTDAAR